MVEKVKAIRSAALVMVVVTACGTGTEAVPRDASEDRHYLLETLGHYCDSARWVGPETLAETLSEPGAAVLVGAVEDAQVTRAFKLAEDGDAEGIEVAPDARDWDWAEVTVTMTGADEEPGKPLTMTAYQPGEIDRFIAGIRALDSAVIVTQPTQRDYRWPADCHRLVGLVDEEGGVSFPALGEREAAFVGELDTVQELLAVVG